MLTTSTQAFFYPDLGQTLPFTESLDEMYLLGPVQKRKSDRSGRTVVMFTQEYYWCSWRSLMVTQRDRQILRYGRHSLLWVWKYDRTASMMASVSSFVYVRWKQASPATFKCGAFSASFSYSHGNAIRGCFGICVVWNLPNFPPLPKFLPLNHTGNRAIENSNVWCQCWVWQRIFSASREGPFHRVFHVLHLVIRIDRAVQCHFFRNWTFSCFWPLVFAACLNIACITLQKDFKQWFAELSVDTDKVSYISCLLIYVTNAKVYFQLMEVIRLILNLYDMWKNFDDKKEIPLLLSKVPKPKSPSR